MAKYRSGWSATSWRRAGCLISLKRFRAKWRPVRVKKTRQNKESQANRLMRDILQPGPPAPERIQWVEARGRAFSFTLEAGFPLLDAARRGFATEGFAGGTPYIN